MHRNPKNTRNTDFLCSGTKLLLPSWLLGFQHEERETQSLLCWLIHLTQQHVGTRSPLDWPHPAQKSIHFVLPQISTNCFFLKITQNLQPIAYGHDVIHIPSHISYPGFLSWYLWLSHPPCASMNTCAQCAPLPVH